MKARFDYFGRFLRMPNTEPTSGSMATPTGTQTVEQTTQTPETITLDRWDVEKQVKICRPDNAPLDQLIRMEVNSRPTRSQRFEFLSSTQNDGIYKLSQNGNDNIPVTLDGNDIPKSFKITLDQSVSDLLPDDVLACVDLSPMGYSWNYRDNKNDNGASTVPLTLQVLDKVAGNIYNCIVINGNGENGDDTVDLNGKTFFRIGNAKNELDVLNEAYNLMPTKDGNFAQRFMKVVAESDYQALIEKEADWGLEQYRSASMYAHRMEVELSMFTGMRRHITPYADKGEVYYTGGFDDFLRGHVSEHYVLGGGTPLTLSDIQEWGRRVFSNSNGGQERYMFISPLFMQEILKIPQLMTANNTILRVTDAMDLKGQKLGFSLRKLDTGYGIINLVMHKALAGRRDYRGYIIDTTNIRRRVLQSAIARKVDLEEKMIKKANAIIIEECCGLEIQNKDTMLLVDLKKR